MVLRGGHGSERRTWFSAAVVGVERRIVLGRCHGPRRSRRRSGHPTDRRRCAAPGRHARHDSDRGPAGSGSWTGRAVRRRGAGEWVGHVLVRATGDAWQAHGRRRTCQRGASHPAGPGGTATGRAEPFGTAQVPEAFTTAASARDRAGPSRRVGADARGMGWPGWGDSAAGATEIAVAVAEVDVTPAPQTWLVVATLHRGARRCADRRPRSELHASTLNPRQWQVNGPIRASGPRCVAGDLNTGIRTERGWGRL